MMHHNDASFSEQETNVHNLGLYGERQDINTQFICMIINERFTGSLHTN